MMSKQIWRRAVGTSVCVGMAVVSLGAGVRQAARPVTAPVARAAQKIDEEYTKKIVDNTPDKRILTELVDHMPLPVDQGAVAAEVPRLHSRRERQADLSRRTSSATSRRSTRRPTRVKLMVDRQDRRRPRHGRASRSPTKRRSGKLDKYKQITAQLTDPRKLTDAQAKTAHRDRQADLLRQRQHPLAGDRQPRDADGAGLPARDRGDAVHPDDPQQRHRRVHAGDRSGRPREAGRQPARAAGAASRAPGHGLLGQVRRSTTTTATASARASRSRRTC